MKDESKVTLLGGICLYARKIRRKFARIRSEMEISVELVGTSADGKKLYEVTVGETNFITDEEGLRRIAAAFDFAYEVAD